MPKSVLPRAHAPPPLDKREARARARGSTIFETFKAQMLKSVLARARAPPPPRRPEAKARARGSTNFETFRAQNAEICTPPERLEHGRGGVRISRLSKCRNLYSGAGEYDFRDFQGSKCRNLYCPAPVPPAASTPEAKWEYEFRNFQGSKCRDLYSPALVPPRSWTKERPEHWHGGSTSFETFRAQKCRNLSSPAPAPMPPAQSPEHGHGAVPFSRLSRLKKPGSTNFETFKAQKAEICTPPRPCPPVSWTPEARARARGSTIFETAQNVEICTPPRPCPPAAWTPEAKARARGSTNFETFKAQNAEICTPPRPWPPALMDPMQVWKNFHIMSSTSTLEPQLALQATLEPHGPGIGQEWR